MSHPGHKIVKCSGCGKTIMQCRCMDKDKPVEYGICPDCLNKPQQLDLVSRAAEVAAASLIDLARIIEEAYAKPSGE